jgi:hypothetical protein
VELGASAAQEIWDSGSYYVWLLEMPAILPGVANSHGHNSRCRTGKGGTPWQPGLQVFRVPVPRPALPRYLRDPEDLRAADIPGIGLPAVGEKSASCQPERSVNGVRSGFCVARTQQGRAPRYLPALLGFPPHATRDTGKPQPENATTTGVRDRGTSATATQESHNQRAQPRHRKATTAS